LGRVGDDWVDLNRILSASMLPIAGLVLLEIAITMASFVPLFGSFFSQVSMLVVAPLILFWAGWRVAQMEGTNLSDGAMAGAFAGLLSSLVNGILRMIWAIGRVSLPVSFFVATLLAISYKLFAFFVFKVVSDFGQFVGILEYIFQNKVSR